jgi:synaptosomal-associated protein 29
LYRRIPLEFYVDKATVMANKYPTNRNPFGANDLEEEEHGNFGQPRRPPGGQFGPRSGSLNYSSNQGFDSAPSQPPSAHSHIQAQLQSSRERTLESQQRALQSIYTSERLGVATAEELLDQGEKLKRTEKRLDDIEDMQKQTQRQINSLSSVFGGVKNWFAKKPNNPNPGANSAVKGDEPPPQPSSKLSQVISTRRDSEPMPPSGQAIQGSVPNSNKSGYQVQYDQNLDQMSRGIQTLKTLGLGLKDELQTQNEGLERMGNKMDKVNTTMKGQDRQLNTLLYGKK